MEVWFLILEIQFINCEFPTPYTADNIVRVGIGTNLPVLKHADTVNSITSIAVGINISQNFFAAAGFLYHKKHNQKWLFFKSWATTVFLPTSLSEDFDAIRVDRHGMDFEKLIIWD